MIIERGMTSHDRSYYYYFLYFVRPQTTEAHVTCGLSSIVFTTWSDVFTSPWDVVHRQTGRRAGFFSFFISHCCITSSFKQLIVISSLSAPYNYPASLLLYTRESNNAVIYIKVQSGERCNCFCGRLLSTASQPARVFLVFFFLLTFPMTWSLLYL